MTVEDYKERAEELVREHQYEELFSFLSDLDYNERLDVLNHTSSKNLVQLLSSIKPDEGAKLLSLLPYTLQVHLLNELDNETTASIIKEFNSDEKADLIGDLEGDPEEILSTLKPREASSIRNLIKYDEDTAGGLMITEYLAFDEKLTVEEVTNKLRKNAAEYEKYNVQYIYVLSEDRFSGVLRMRDLLLSKPEKKLSSIVIKSAKTLNVNTSFDELRDFFYTFDFYGVPVVNDENMLVGIVLRKSILETETEKASQELLETQGIVGGEELRSLPVLTRSKRRLSWLSVNILLNILAASVIAIYQDTLTSVIALAVFLPVISDMSGCSGNQAVAVSLRELSLGVTKPMDILKVLWHEMSVGIINGIVLGILIGIAAFIWKSNIYLGLVVGSALALNTLVAVSIGGTIPLILKRFDADPALASGPILTTITDMLGFFLALSFGTIFISHL
jgi:magnesium transporter